MKVINSVTAGIFKEIQADLKLKDCFLITSHSFKSEDTKGTIVKTKGIGRLSFQQFIKNNQLENVAPLTKDTNISFYAAGKRTFAELESSVELIPMTTAMQYIKNELSNYATFDHQSEYTYKRFIIKKKKGVLITLVFSILCSPNGGDVVLYFDEINDKVVNPEPGFYPMKEILFATVHK